jgi:hypothetical protein
MQTPRRPAREATVRRAAILALLLLLAAPPLCAGPPGTFPPRGGADPSPALPGEEYFVIMFGSQQVRNKAKFSHSFATFVKATPGPDGLRMKHLTISWLPEDLDINLLKPLPEVGVALGLHTTLRYVLGSGERVSQWGPYRIEKELYDRARARLEQLTSGAIKYKAVDVGHPAGGVKNCIRALSDLGEGGRLRISTLHWGEPASYQILRRRLLPWILDGGREYPWVAEHLGLGAYPLIRRDLHTPPHGFPRHFDGP